MAKKKAETFVEAFSGRVNLSLFKSSANIVINNNNNKS